MSAPTMPELGMPLKSYGPEGGAPTAVVSYADLDLSSSAGLATLNGRISRAASSICTESGR